MAFCSDARKGYEEITF